MKTGVLVALAALSLVGVGVVSAATLAAPAQPAYSGGMNGGMQGGYGGGMMGGGSGMYGGGMMGGGGCGCQNYQYCQQYMYDHNYTWDHDYGMMS
ncbi:MAG: hypothetical protein AABX97_00065 [Candidatus Thermoplasmatota archaeon]